MVGEDVIMSVQGACGSRVAGMLGRRKTTISGNWRAHHSRRPGQPNRGFGDNVEKKGHARKRHDAMPGVGWEKGLAGVQTIAAAHV